MYNYELKQVKLGDSIKAAVFHEQNVFAHDLHLSISIQNSTWMYVVSYIVNFFTNFGYFKTTSTYELFYIYLNMKKKDVTYH